MRKTIFANNEYYHIYNRGVDKRKIFLDRTDYIRFIHNLYEFNDENPAIEFSRLNHHVGGLASHIEPRSRAKLVEIVCFCLMPNHFHLILKQLVDNGISRFMHKLGTGYTMAFNVKRNRSGVLFQGTFKTTHVKNETYLSHLSRYIHLNPSELKNLNWKREGVKEVNQFLENYRWSSYLDYIGKENFPSVINKELILGIFDSNDSYKEFTRGWLAEDEATVKDSILE